MNILPKVSYILFIDVIPCLTYELQTGGTMDLLNPMFQQILIYSTSPVDIGSLSLSPGIVSRSFVSACSTLRLSESQEWASLHRTKISYIHVSVETECYAKNLGHISH